MPHVRLGEIASFVRKGIFDINADAYTETGVPFVRITNIQSGLISTDNIAFIPPDIHEAESKTALFRGDIVLSKTAYAAAAWVNLTECNASQDTVAVRLSPAGRKRLRSGAIVTFLNSAHGRALMWRQFQGNVQAHLSLPDAKKLPLPIFGEPMQQLLEESLIKADASTIRSKQSLAAAEQTLLHALGLDAWQPPEPLTYMRRATEVLTAVRLDAEHFKPKFDDLIAHLIAGGDAVRLDKVLSFCERGQQPNYANEGVTVVNSRHVRTDAVIIDGENRHATVEDKTLLIRHGDILLNGTGVGTIGRVTTYLHDTPALPDNHVTILRLHPESGFDPVFLAVQLAGVVGQTQVAQHTRGSSGQLELYPQDIRRILVWRAPREMQLAVRKNIEAAHAARREAQALLARAQRGVEIAIEQGEPAALTLLDVK